MPVQLLEFWINLQILDNRGLPEIVGLKWSHVPIEGSKSVVSLVSHS